MTECLLTKTSPIDLQSQEIAAYVVDLIIEREDETKKANIADRIRQQEVYDREYALADEFVSSWSARRGKR